MRVPVADGNLVQRGDGVSQRFQAADSGPGIGGAIEGLGQTVGRVAEVQDRLNAQLDEAGAKDADTSFVSHSNDVLHDGQDAFFNKKGKDALLARQGVEDGLKTYASELIGKATTPRMKRMVTDALNQRLVGIGAQVGAYTGQQTFEYNKDETAGRIAAATSAAGNSYLDPKVAEQNIATLRTEAGNYASMTGMGPEASSAFTLSKISAARKDIASRLIAEDVRGPEVGRAYLEKYAADFTSDDAQYLSHYVRTQQDYYRAQAHREEVQRKAEERAGLEDDRHLVADYKTAAGIGPRPPAETAAAQAAAARIAAKTGSNGPALEVAKVATQNGVRVAYQNSTPAELQARINELAPHTRGSNPDLNAVTELETLQSMRSQSDTQLKNDPLSWAASHMGINAGQINWNDSGSISQRISVASRVAARTGYPPKILTQDEASLLAATAADPDKGKQAGLIFDLAKLGPRYASIAARQVAPNDHRLAGLVGLATVPNRGVAQALVSKALQGPEIIKGNPKIISNNFDGTFQGSVGNLFRLMPGAQNGVREIARNLLATNAFMSGIHEDADTTGDRGTVLASINGALGQYNDHGVLRGGIGTHSGKPTILPEGFSQQDFDATIARSNAKQVLGASNGAPVWGNGKAITNTKDLWGMEMVPVGNGRYRFFDGSGYVARKDGGFFELDLNRMR